MKIIKTENYQKLLLTQWGPRFNEPEELEGPEADIAGTDEQLIANYVFVKAMVAMNLAEFGGFKRERIDQILIDFRKDLERAEIDLTVVEQHASQAEALRDNPQGLMGFFKHNSPIPGSHSEHLRQEKSRQDILSKRTGSTPE